jgi:hypothetical protein
LLHCVAILTAHAQKISGAVYLQDGKPAEFATVLLCQASDSSLVKGAISNETGQYEIENVAAGDYLLKCNLIGSGNVNSPVFHYAGDALTLEPLRFQATEQQLGQVVVLARKPIVEVRADKTILNVEGNINSQGQNALELLRKAPGVTVDNNDNIAIKGKNAVRFQIDGRDVPLDSKDLANQLKSMRAEEIAAIEMITNPSAKYDASGNAGIINFRTKKNKAFGTNGSFGGEGTYGKSLKGGGNLAFNHRNKQVNVFGTYSNHFGDWYNNINIYREQKGSQTDPNQPNYNPSRVYDQSSEMKDNNNNHNFKLGADYFLNEKNTIGFIVDGRHAHGPWHNSSRMPIAPIETPNEIESILVASNHQPQSRDNFNFNLNYRFADTSGHVLTFDANRGLYRYRADSYQPNKYYDASGENLISENISRNNTPTDIDIVILKADWEQNLWKGKFGVGFKLNQVETDNVFDFFNVIDGAAVINVDNSNRFVYKEMVNAGYLNYQFQAKKWGFQAGLRAEHTEWNGALSSYKPEDNQTPEDAYLNWFPSAAINYSIDQKNQLNLSYSRRIDRPSYRDLNPFENKLDELTYQKGNPYLRPQFTHSLEMTHTFMGFLNTTLGYSHTNDLFTQYIDTASNGRTYQSQGNIAKQDNWSLNISSPLPIAKWWEGFISLTGVLSSFDAKFREGFEYSVSFNSLNVYSEHTFRLPQGWSLQASGWYNTPTVWQAVFRTKSMGSLDLGVKKELFDGKGTLGLSVGDVLGTAGFNIVNDFTPGLYMKGHGNWESQNVKVNFNYRFGNNNVKGSRQRKTGAEDVNSRIKSGN